VSASRPHAPAHATLAASWQEKRHHGASEVDESCPPSPFRALTCLFPRAILRQEDGREEVAGAATESEIFSAVFRALLRTRSRYGERPPSPPPPPPRFSETPSAAGVMFSEQQKRSAVEANPVCASTPPPRRCRAEAEQQRVVTPAVRRAPTPARAWSEVRDTPSRAQRRRWQQVSAETASAAAQHAEDRRQPRFARTRHADSVSAQAEFHVPASGRRRFVAPAEAAFAIPGGTRQRKQRHAAR